MGYRMGKGEWGVDWLIELRNIRIEIYILVSVESLILM